MGKFGPIHSPFLFSSGRIPSIHPHPIYPKPSKFYAIFTFFCLGFFFLTYKCTPDQASTWKGGLIQRNGSFSVKRKHIFCPLKACKSIGVGRVICRKCSENQTRLANQSAFNQNWYLHQSNQEENIKTNQTQ